MVFRILLIVIFAELPDSPEQRLALRRHFHNRLMVHIRAVLLRLQRVIAIENYTSRVVPIRPVIRGMHEYLGQNTNDSEMIQKTIQRHFVAAVRVAVHRRPHLFAFACYEHTR